MNNKVLILHSDTDWILVQNQNTEYTSIIPENLTIDKYFKKLLAKSNMTPYEENQLERRC